MRPAVSVIIPTYNRNSFLKKAVDSVLSQSYSRFELIIIDDGSTDDTRALVSQYNDKRLRYVYQDNQGVARARNRGLELAQGEWIAFLDSDDWWMDKKLERACGYMKEYPEIRIFHTEEKWFRQGKVHNPKTKHQKPGGWVYPQAVKLCCISISTAVIHRSVFDDTGCFDETFEACEDYDFWLRATHKYEVKLIPECLTEKDGGRPDQLSMSVWGLDRFRIRALDKMLTSGKLNEEKTQLTALELKRKSRIFIQGAQKRGREVGEYVDILNRTEKKDQVIRVSG